jgi:glycosyltransferase involved in cell wall biosynthesis
MITYNHEQYIGRAINSVLRQNVGFEYEIVIGEDCSTDNTREVLTAYKNSHPNLIKLKMQNINIGMNNNLINTFEACTGEYIAILEGDDFWISPDKLSKQVNLLDNYPPYAMCFHDVVQLEQSTGRLLSWALRTRQTSYRLEDLLQGNFIPTGAVVFRRNLIDKFPDFSSSLGMLDWLINILVASHGDIGFLDEVMGVYNIHSGGVWSSKSRLHILSASIDAAKKIMNIIDPKYRSILQNTISTWQSEVDDITSHIAPTSDN